GTLAVWFANALRLTILIAIGTWISQDVAMGGFHAYSGSLLFSAIAILLVFAVRRSSFFMLDPARADTRAEPPTNETAAYLVPFLAIVATQMLAGATSTGASTFDLLYPVRVAAAFAALVAFRRGYDTIRHTCSWQAVAVGVLVFVMWMALEPAPDPAKQ